MVFFFLKNALAATPEDDKTWTVVGSLDWAMQKKIAEDLLKKISTESPTDNPKDQSSATSDQTSNHHNSADHEHIISYPITQTDFERVQTPFIIGIWILSASIAKIGEFSIWKDTIACRML